MNPLAQDLDEVLQDCRPAFEALRGESLLITGGTGFVGSWLLESFLWANDRLHLCSKVTVLTRDPASFFMRCPWLAAHPAVDLQVGDVRTFSLPSSAQYRFAIHAAAETRPDVQREHPEAAVEVSLKGTRHVLEVAAEHGVQRILYVSSGVVYDSGTPMSEDQTWEEEAPNPYALGKRLAESYALLWANRHTVELKVARCFSFIGPYLPIDRSFAAGNFIRDALQGGPVIARLPGSIRSYLYAGDMCGWLWRIFSEGANRRPYNVGSDRAISTVELARAIAEKAGVELSLQEETGAPSLAGFQYVPNVDRARRELGLTARVDLPESIRRTLAWHGESVAHRSPELALSR